MFFQPVILWFFFLFYSIIQKIRDVLLMVPDIFHVILPIWLYSKTRRENYFHRDRKLKLEIMVTIAIVLILLMIMYLLWICSWNVFKTMIKKRAVHYMWYWKRQWVDCFKCSLFWPTLFLRYLYESKITNLHCNISFLKLNLFKFEQVSS